MAFRLSVALVWFRRDLRLFDHTALANALEAAERVHCAFVYDQPILDALRDRADRRVDFIHRSVGELAQALSRAGGELIVVEGDARSAIPALARDLGADAVFADRDYEPPARLRDAAVARALEADGRTLETCKDQVIFEAGEVRNAQRRPFVVFTPYRRAWLARLDDEALRERMVRTQGRLARRALPGTLPSLESLGFARTDLDALGVACGESGARATLARFVERIGRYHLTRDFPAQAGPSRLSVHLRFGTVSIRELVRLARQAAIADPQAAEGAQAWLSELVWREFFATILAEFPQVTERAFDPAFDAIAWNDDEAAFDAWTQARTGYPLVDAAMRELLATGSMHNRLRMVSASFLVKDLGIDWRRGERWFAERLLDYDLASNNGNWQWVASTGCDAQPWFRIFNPVTQSRRFDPEGRYIRRWLPELAGLRGDDVHEPWRARPLELAAAGVRLGSSYPLPIVDHARAREQTLARYAAVRNARPPSGGSSRRSS